MLRGNCGDSGQMERSISALRQRRRQREARRELLVWPATHQDAVAAESAARGNRVSASATPASLYGAAPAGQPTTALLPTPIRSNLQHDGQPPLGFDARPLIAGAPVHGLSWLWQLLGQEPSGRTRWAELLRLVTTAAERPVRAEMLNTIGQFAQAAGDLDIAHGFFQEGLVAGRASQNAESLVRSLDGLAGIAVTCGAFELARMLQDEALTIRRRLRDQRGVARTLALLGWLLLETRGTEHAEALLAECLTIRVQVAQEVGQVPESRLLQAHGLVHLGWLAHLNGQRELARIHLAEALALTQGTHTHANIVSLLALLGRLTTAETPARAAAQLLIGAELQVAAGAEHTGCDTDLSGYRAEAWVRLTPAALAVAWGDAPDADSAVLVEQALCAADARAAVSSSTVSTGVLGHHNLTARELEVAHLIGKGHTNRRIADELVIGERTAETHARNIREKLGMSTRSQVAAWAAVRAMTPAT